MIFFFIVLCILTIGLFIASIIMESLDRYIVGMINTLLIVYCCLAGVILFYEQEQEPQAIDVYRGYTTLEITYRDSIAIDSVVVFRNIEE